MANRKRRDKKGRPLASAGRANASGAGLPRAKRLRASDGGHADRTRSEGRNAQPNAGGGGLSCPVERACGACQHVGQPYAEQLAAKDAHVAQLFADVAPSEALRPILGMEDPYHYRNKVVSPYAPGRRLAGGGEGD